MEKDAKGRMKNRIKHWSKFFSPVYATFVVLFAGYYLGLIEAFALASFLVYGTVVFTIGLLAQKSYPNLFPYLGRNIYHSLGGVAIVISSMFFLDITSLLLLLFSIFILFFTGFVMERIGIETMFSHGHTLKHVKDFAKSTHYEAGAAWLFSCLVLLLFFDLNVAYASILILAISDTAAGFVGSSMGRRKNPLNQRKTIEGTMAFFSTAVFAAMLFVPTSRALVVAFIAAIVEALPLKINDNLSVPLSAGVIMHLLKFL